MKFISLPGLSASILYIFTKLCFSSEVEWLTPIGHKTYALTWVWSQPFLDRLSIKVFSDNQLIAVQVSMLMEPRPTDFVIRHHSNNFTTNTLQQFKKIAYKNKQDLLETSEQSSTSFKRVIINNPTIIH